MTAPHATDRGPLLTLAAKAQGAADDGGAEQLERHLRSFVPAFVSHLRQFVVMRSRLRPVDAAGLRRGHAAVAASARALLHEVAAGCAGSPGRCSDRAEALRALLTLQDRDERRALRAVPVLVEPEATSLAARAARR